MNFNAERLVEEARALSEDSVRLASAVEYLKTNEPGAFLWVWLIFEGIQKKIDRTDTISDVGRFVETLYEPKTFEFELLSETAQSNVEVIKQLVLRWKSLSALKSGFGVERLIRRDRNIVEAVEFVASSFEDQYFNIDNVSPIGKELTVEQRLHLLDEFHLRHSDESIIEFAQKLFPELANVSSKEQTSRPLPKVAPQLWSKDRQDGETAVAFIKRVYEPWIENGLTRPSLRKLDKPLYLALAKWIERHPDWKEFDIPTKPEMVDQWVERVAKGDEAPPTDYKERTRLQSAQQRRKD